MSRTFKVGKVEARFENESWETRSSWGHKTRLYINDNFVGEHKVRYINRTWEVYQYQSCMKGVLWNYIDELLKEYIQAYKDANGVKRLTKGLKEELEAKCKLANPDLYEVYNLI